MVNEEERHLILQMIESGKISAEEGLRLLDALGEETPAEPEESAGEPYQEPASLEDLAGLGPESPFERTVEPQVEVVHHPDGPAASLPPAPEMDKFRRFWMVPLWIGVGIVVLAGWWMFSAQQNSGFGFWFYCSWVPFMLGLAVMVLAWYSRTARWLHVRVHQKSGDWPQKIAISFPLPTRLTAWFLRNFGSKMRGFEHTSIDELLQALENTTSSDNPLYIEVDEGEDGEKVQVFIG